MVPTAPERTDVTLAKSAPPVILRLWWISSPQDQPLLQRILVVADSFDAMRSRRPYRDTVPEEEVRLELNRCAGRSMDPTVTEILLRLLNRGELDQAARERETEPGASKPPAGAAVGLLERLENDLLLLGCDSNTRVGNGERHDAG